MTLDQKEVSKLLSLYERERSLKKVSKLAKHSINTVDKYVSKQFNVNRQSRIRKLHSDNEVLIGAFIGLWAGDGSRFYNGGWTVQVHTNLRDTSLNNFIQGLLATLFDKTAKLFCQEGNQARFRFESKFIYHFIEQYLSFQKNKSNTVCLKNNISSHSMHFLKGFLVGLMLSDGCFKNSFCFVSTSKNLARNVLGMLDLFGFLPLIRKQDRAKYGWRDLYFVSLKKEDTSAILRIMDSTLIEAGWSHGFLKLKYGPGAI